MPSPLPFQQDRILASLQPLLQGPKPASGALALFDWDGTLADTDTGDLLFFHAALNGLLALPARGRDAMPWLTDAGWGFLETLVEGSRHQDRQLCLQQLANYYAGGRTDQGLSVYAEGPSQHFEPSYAILGPLLAGLPEETLRAQCRLLIQEGRSASGHLTLPEGRLLQKRISLVAPLAELLAQVRALGLTVVVVSASPQVLVEEGLASFGLEVDAVLGLRCHPDGTLASPGAGSPWPCIPYKEGKLAWLDWWLAGGDQGRASPGGEGARRPVLLAAGNSSGDVPMLARARAARVFVREGQATPPQFSDGVPLWVQELP